MADPINNAKDTELLAIGLQFCNAITGSPSAFGLTAAQATALNSQKEAFSDALDAHLAAKASAWSAREAKDVERDGLESLLRSYRSIAKAAGTNESLMATLGIPGSAQSLPENATVPITTVDTSVRLRHTIHFVDAEGNGNKRKPRGVIGCEIWLKLDGPTPTDETQCTFLTLDTATPYVAEYNGSDGGKRAHYMTRWAMRDGSKGGWGETVSATITA